MNPTKTRKSMAIAAAVIFVTVVGTVAYATHVGQALSNPPQTTTLAFHDEMRKLWEDHATWTRLVIVSFVVGLPDTGPTVDRLLKNQDDIGASFSRYYGDTAGNQLATLLRDHIVIAAEILDAAKRGDNTALNEAPARWYSNANDIAAFWNGLNPKNWPLDHMQSMMRTHLDLTLQEAVAQLTGDYQTSISTYETVHAQILEMADMLSSGIIQQFPQRFTSIRV